MNFLDDEKQRDDRYASAWEGLRIAHAESQDPLSADAAVKTLIPLVSARIAALHEALRGLGLPAAELREDSVRLIGTTDKVVQLAFRDSADQDIKLEIAWNGTAFLAGRRYEASLSRIGLSDAEITRSAILRVDIDRSSSSIVITFLTLDGKDARIRIHASRPFDPEIEGTIPEMSKVALKGHASLADLCARTIESTERAGALKGFFSRLTDGKARQAQSDLHVLSTFLAENTDTGANPKDWAHSPHSLRQVAEAVLRRLSDAHDTAQPLMIRALIIIAVGQILSPTLEPA